MQVFLPYPNDLVKSAQSLDDLRLNKQITEINQILLTYVNGGGGHSEHPVNKWYKCNQGIEFIFNYQSILTDEYDYRFKKHHMGKFTYWGLTDEMTDEDNHTKVFGYMNNTKFTPAYIKGQRNKDQIITTDNIDELYQQLLCEKWDNDKVEPKWTGRDKPKFYNQEVGHND